MALVQRELGRQGLLYVGIHAAYGDTPTPASADAMRHIQFLTSHDPTNRRNNPEKKNSPGYAARHTGRETAALRELTAFLRPSGTLNTVPECTRILEAAFGATRNTTLSTTVSAGTGAVGGATLASTTGLAVNDFLLILCPDGKKYARRITTLPGANVVTWAPNLTQAPADGAAVKAGITYRLTTPLSTALWFAHYRKKTDNTTAGLKRLLKGVGIDRFTLTFDANDEPRFTCSGPAQTQLASGVPAKPGAFTMVGGNPPSGHIGEAYVGNNRYDSKKVEIELINNVFVRNDEFGYAQARELYRRGRQEVNVSLDAFAEDQTLLYDMAVAGTDTSWFFQDGFTEGNIVACAMPRVETKVPDDDDPDEEVNWPFKGVGYESADDGLDQLVLALL